MHEQSAQNLILICDYGRISYNGFKLTGSFCLPIFQTVCMDKSQLSHMESIAERCPLGQSPGWDGSSGGCVNVNITLMKKFTKDMFCRTELWERNFCAKTQ